MENMKQNDKIRNTPLGAGYIRHLQMLKANSPISFPVLVSTLNEGRIFLDMVSYVIINIATIREEDKGSNNDNKSNKVMMMIIAATSSKQ